MWLGAVRSSLLIMVFLSLMVVVVDAKSLLRENQKTSDESSSSSSAQANMTKEEIKLVKLLLKVQKSYPTLNAADQGQLVEKVKMFRDKLESTLSKANSVPGKYGLDLPLLRKALDLNPATSAAVAEDSDKIEDDLDDVYTDEDLVDEDGEADVTVDSNSDVDAAVHPWDLERKSAKINEESVDPDSDDSSLDSAGQPEDLEDAAEMIQDLSEQVRRLTRLLISLLGAGPPSPPSPSSPSITPVAFTFPHSPFYHQPNAYPNPQIVKKAKIERKEAKKKYTYNANVHRGATPTHIKSQLEAIFDAIPSDYQEMDVNLNYLKRKKRSAGRKKREAESLDNSYQYDSTHYPPAQQSYYYPVSQASTGYYPSYYSDQTMAEYDPYYADPYYQPAYLPSSWELYMQQVQEYYRQMEIYNLAVALSAIPEDPMGSWNKDQKTGGAVYNPFRHYSKHQYLRMVDE